MFGALFCSITAMLISLPQPTRSGIGRIVGAFIFLNTHSWYFKSVRDPMNSDSYLPRERAVREGLKAMGSHFHVQSIKGRSLQIVNIGHYWNGTHIRVLSTRTSDMSHMSPETHTARHTQAYLDACVRFGAFAIHGKQWSRRKRGRDQSVCLFPFRRQSQHPEPGTALSTPQA